MVYCWISNCKVIFFKVDLIDTVKSYSFVDLSLWNLCVRSNSLVQNDKNDIRV